MKLILTVYLIVISSCSVIAQNYENNRDNFKLNGPVKLCIETYTPYRKRLGRFRNKDRENQVVIYEFDSDGRIIKMDNNTYSNYLNSYTYDEQGRVITVTTKKPNYQSTVVDSLVYHSSGEIAERYTKARDAEDFRLKTSNIYDALGRLTSTTNYRRKDEISKQVTYHYDGPTEIMTHKFYSEIGDTMISEIRTTYDALDRPSIISYYKSSDSIYLVEDYTYDDAGHLIEKKAQDLIPEPIRLGLNVSSQRTPMSEKYTYSDEGQLLEKQWRIEFTGLTNSIHYEYDTLGNISKSTEHSIFDNTDHWANSEVHTYEYDERNNCIKEVINWHDQRNTITREFDQHNNYIKIVRRSKRGKRDKYNRMITYH